ncbi:diguanylate cyclase (GGDEF)-like protein [Rhizobium aquaticum]|uniref:Diguanylate cyclase (GGDEF)-like protein n=1 Tax=Rhizobium aquaticum TaxID=1549636 RepID=A0ABV2J2T0_9HYPH
MYSELIARGTTGDIAAGAATSLEQFHRIQDLFDKTFRVSRVGIWVCTLPDEKLTWTDTVFDLFDLDPQSPLRRSDIVALYTPGSREALGKLRSAAIADGQGFTLDAEIVTGKGRTRWIRITAIVERVDGIATRLFGMKQDITAEKMMFEQVRYAAEVDPLTELASRAKFDSVFSDIYAGRDPLSYGLLLIDLDGFKAVNDRLGHQAGDQCLAMAGQRLLKALPQARLIARLGGDEFAVLYPCETTEALRGAGHRIVEALEYWWGRGSDKLKLTASVGAALIDRDIAAKDVFSQADKALYRVKAEGKGGLQMASEIDITNAA